MIKDLIKKNRSYRRFYQDVPIGPETLRDIVDLARLSASAANLQPLKYILSSDPEKNSLIFPCLGWAAYLKDWDGPPEGERPSAYIIVLCDTNICKDLRWPDHGIACQSILLGAVDLGYGGCMIGSVNHQRLRDVLDIPKSYEILLAIALGKPMEDVVIDEVGPQGDIKYRRDSKGVHHVPKRSLDEIIVDQFG